MLFYAAKQVINFDTTYAQLITYTQTLCGCVLYFTQSKKSICGAWAQFLPFCSHKPQHLEKPREQFHLKTLR